MPWPLGEASLMLEACLEHGLVHPGGLEPPCLAAAASQAGRAAASPRVRDWCWLEDSNPAPLAYKASALPDELSQQIGKRIAAPLPVWKRTCLNGPVNRRRVQFWTFTMSKSAAPVAP